MTGDQLWRSLERLGFKTHLEAAEFFGRHRSSVTRFVRGDRQVPNELAALVRLMLEGTVSKDAVERAIGKD
jgi:hypothetical protein